MKKNKKPNIYISEYESIIRHISTFVATAVNVQRWNTASEHELIWESRRALLFRISDRRRSDQHQTASRVGRRRPDVCQRCRRLALPVFLSGLFSDFFSSPERLVPHLDFGAEKILYAGA